MTARTYAKKILHQTNKNYNNFVRVNDLMIDELTILVERKESITLETVLNIAKKYKNQ
jgi:plasmid maintenance system antidote protein VapI